MLGSTEMGLIGPTDGFPSGMALGAPEGTLEGAYVGYFVGADNGQVAHYNDGSSAAMMLSKMCRQALFAH